VIRHHRLVKFWVKQNFDVQQILPNNIWQKQKKKLVAVKMSTRTATRMKAQVRPTVRRQGRHKITMIINASDVAVKISICPNT